MQSRQRHSSTRKQQGMPMATQAAAMRGRRLSPPRSWPTLRPAVQLQLPKTLQV